MKLLYILVASLSLVSAAPVLHLRSPDAKDISLEPRAKGSDIFEPRPPEPPPSIGGIINKARPDPVPGNGLEGHAGLDTFVSRP